MRFFTSKSNTSQYNSNKGGENAYAFGQLLVFSLYQQFKIEGESFKPRYLKILSAGGSEAPAKILEDAGINIRDPKFWQGGFDVLEKLVSELEKLPVGVKAKGKVKGKKVIAKKTVKAKPAKHKSTKKK